MLHPVVLFALGQVRLPAQAKLHVEPLTKPDIIVDVGANIALPAIERLEISLLKKAGQPKHEIGQRVAGGFAVEGHRAIGYDVISCN